MTVLIVAYPHISTSEFGFWYTATLIAAMGIDCFARYYFGISNELLLTADQHGYVQSLVQTVGVILNITATAVMIRMGASIQMVKLVTSLIFVIRPIFLYYYVRRHYDLDWGAGYDKSALEQKWSGLAQHIANTVLISTDTIVLTVFSTLSNVSVYNVHYIIIKGIDTLLQAMRNGVMALLGDLWTNKEMDKLKELFETVVWGQNTLAVFVFGCTTVLIGPFVRVYTDGITDVDYQVPLFAFLITIAYLLNSMRVPFHIMILAGNHYRQTQRCYIVGAGLNIIISVAAVVRFGLVGVAVGTVVGMAYQTIWMARYCSRELVKWPLRKFFRQVAVDVVSFVPAYLLTFRMTLQSVSYLAWFVLAVKTALVWLAVVGVVNCLLYRRNIMYLVKKLLHTEN